MSNYGRNNLIMHFACAECGNLLDLVYDSSEKVTSETFSEIKGHHPSEPTGAYCRYVPTVQILPCRPCIEKYTKSAKKLIDSIKEMSEA